jgi:hypothetical protein
MSYDYPIEFTSAANDQWTLVSILDSVNSHMTINGCMKQALSTGPPTWTNAQLPPRVWPALAITVPATFVYEEVVNGLKRVVEYAGTASYLTSGVLNLACNHPAAISKLVGWKTIDFDFVHV